MNRRAVAAALILCVMMASVSCSNKPSPTVIHEAETFGTSGTTRAEPGFMDEVYEQVVLSSESGVTYDFKYDSDILSASAAKHMLSPLKVYRIFIIQHFSGYCNFFIQLLK